MTNNVVNLATWQPLVCYVATQQLPRRHRAEMDTSAKLCNIATYALFRHDLPDNYCSIEKKAVSLQWKKLMRESDERRLNIKPLYTNPTMREQQNIVKLKIFTIMAIKVKAIERNVSFDKNKEKWAYVLQADLYNKLTQTKVIQEAALRSGIAKGSISAAWDAIGEVLKAWATEGHSVAIPGLGSMRFGLRSKSVTDVNKVAATLITSRRVIFTPSTDILKQLADTSVNITCYDRDGNVVKRVTSGDSGNVEEGSEYDCQIVLTAQPAEGGTVTGAGGYMSGDSVTIKAVAAAGYSFVKWSDNVTDAERTFNAEQDMTLEAIFKLDDEEQGGGIGE